MALKPEAELESTLDRLVAAGLLFRQGVPPHASYLFKHALVQDAAYGTLLREPRRALHARIAEALESQFAEIAERQPELLARHCTEAGLIEKAAGLWGKAGQRSLERSALVEAADQLTRALAQIATLPATPALRRDEIKLQVAHINTLFNFKGYAAAETKAAVERARLLIEQAEALGEPPEDPLLLFSVLYGFWVANYVAFNGDVMRELAAQFLSLAETQGAIVPRMIGHRILGVALMYTGDIVESRPHFDRAIALYDPAQHRPLAARFGADVGVTVSTHRPLALWVLGYPEAALADVEHALEDAREIPHAATLMHALFFTAWTHRHCGNHLIAKAQLDELVALADEKRLFVLEDARDADATLCFGPGRQDRGLSSHDYLRNRGIPVHGGTCGRRYGYRIWPGPMPTSANSTTPGVASPRQRRQCKQPRKSGARRRPSHGRRNRAQVATSGFC